MNWKSTIRHLLAILVLQCLGGCVTTDKDAALDACLNNLEDRIAHTLINPVGPPYTQMIVACELDYNLRYGTLKKLNRTDIVQHLAQRKSEVVKYEVVARDLAALSKDTSDPDPSHGSGPLETYSHAAAQGPEVARNFLDAMWNWIQLEIVPASVPNGP
jgi:hypothetical protein